MSFVFPFFFSSFHLHHFTAIVNSVFISGSVAQASRKLQDMTLYKRKAKCEPNFRESENLDCGLLVGY